jgi:phosphoribosyl 1,2-cyclic phosphodiesterase
MRVTFWGVRGSLPAFISRDEFAARVREVVNAARDPARRALSPDQLVASLSSGVADTVGGDTSCVQLDAGDEVLIFDAGTGIRRCGRSLMQGPLGRGAGTAHLFFSHTHWDHVIGLPFFEPLFVGGNVIRAHSPAPDLEERLALVFHPHLFPVPWEKVREVLSVENMAENRPLVVGPATIRAVGLPHPGGCYAFRVESGGRSFVYATDAEWGAAPPEAAWRSLLRGADLLVLDAQYTEAEVASKAGWGHGSPVMAVEIALAARAKRLALFHHEPEHADAEVEAIAGIARDHLARVGAGSGLEIILARDGMVCEI